MKYLERSSGFEEFLSELNVAAASMSEPEVSASVCGSAQIVGLPRSGTTVLYQLLARTGAIGYPSNVMAFFHRVPWVGAMLQERLAVTEPRLSLSSIAGRTPEPMDPHEFGYFWRRVCGHTRNSLVQDAEPLQAIRLQRELDLVAEVFQKPVVYKNFLALAHAGTMRRQLSGMQFISVERDRLDSAASLLDMRRRLDVPDDQPFGTEPSSLQPLRGDPVSTVARQVVELERWQSACNFRGNTDSVVVQYADLIRRPRDVVADLLAFLGVTSDRLESAVPSELPAGPGAAALDHAASRDLVAALERADKQAELMPEFPIR